MTNDTTGNTPIAPRYRYYVEDLISGKKLAELDFRGVSYKLALNAAGDFAGSLVVKDFNAATNLYNATLPGVTALYILRNEVCVWGGIIWEREYIPEDKKLSVSASEFTSYLHHRKIWKTWNHEFGATVAYDATTSQWKVVFDYGSNVSVRPGSTVKLEFFEVENFKHNGYFRVAENPAPGKNEFYMTTGSAVADITQTSVRDGNVVTVYTRENHNYNVGDTISLSFSMIGDTEIPPGPPTTVKVTWTGGTNSNFFSYVAAGGAQPDSDNVVTGTASRPLPPATYEKVTVGVRQDTYDYVKSLIEGTFNDFVGTDFPNVYIEPGISTALPIVSKRAFDGYNIVKTAEDHGIAVGQAVQLQDVGAGFDGEFEVLGVEEGRSLVYAGGGDLPETPVVVLSSAVSRIEHLNGTATLTMPAPHNMKAGQTIIVDMGLRFPELTGQFKILDVPIPNKLRYVTGSAVSYPSTPLVNATAVVGANSNIVDSARITSNVATLKTQGAHGFSVGNSVTIANVHRTVSIIEKSLDAPNSVATVQTDGPHGLSVGTAVTLSGLSDVVQIPYVSTRSGDTVFTTAVPHNFRVNDLVDVSGQDVLQITNKQITSNVATLTTNVNHNFSAGDSVTVENLFDNYVITNYRIENNQAILTTSVNHNVKVNDVVVVGALSDYYTVSTKAAVDGNITLTTKVPHNVLENSKIKVTGVGLPFDGEFTVVSVTDQRIMYKASDKYLDAAKAAAKKGSKPAVPITVPEQKVTGANARVGVTDSYVVGEWTVTAVTANTLRYTRGGNDYNRIDTAPTTGKMATLSLLNGVYTLTSATGRNLSYAKTASNSASVAVPPAVKDDEIQATVSKESVYSGQRKILTVTPTTFSFSSILPSTTARNADLSVSKPSIFNGVRTITTVPTADRFTFAMPGTGLFSMVELAQGKAAFAIAESIYPGTYTITAVNSQENSFSFNKTYGDLSEQEMQNRGLAEVHPIAITSTFGPFPGNADIQFVFPDNEYSGVNIEPSLYRGFELKSVGEALDEYSNNIDGFEYRIDCEYVRDEDRFIKKFVILPINFPNPPEEGEVSPISRFGADKLVFEYPSGSISTFSMRESAEESATRFFALGENELGPDVGPYIGVASADELLRGERDGRRWPLLDASDSVDGIDDKNVLYAYAKRFLSELQPPFASFAISVNGSRSPFVGTYKPGDWCSIVVDDPWIQMRLSSDLEPRNDVLVRKIDSISISVPDGVTYPESVTVNLIAEWEVDKRGK